MRFLSGDVNIEQPPQSLSEAADEAFGREAPTAEAAAPERQPLSQSISENQFFEYHLYSVNTTTTINDKEIKQIHLLNAEDIPVDKVYTYDIPGFTSSTDTIPVAVALSLNNTETGHRFSNTLGIPRPSEIVRVYKEDLTSASSGGPQQMIFIGEDTIDHIPRNENLTLQIGNAFDIVGDTTLVSESKSF